MTVTLSEVYERKQLTKQIPPNSTKKDIVEEFRKKPALALSLHDRKTKKHKPVEVAPRGGSRECHLSPTELRGCMGSMDFYEQPPNCCAVHKSSVSAVGKESWRTATFHRAGESRRLEGISGTHPAHTLLGAERLSEMHWCHRAARAPPAEQGEPAPEYGNKAGRGSSLNDKMVSPRVPNVEGRTCMAMLMIPTSSNTYFEKFRSYNCLVAAPFRSQKTLPSSRTPPISGAAAERSQQPRWLQADRKTPPCSHLREAPAWAMSCLSTVSDETKKKQKITIRLIADFYNTLGKYLLTAQKTRKKSWATGETKERFPGNAPASATKQQEEPWPGLAGGEEQEENRELQTYFFFLQNMEPFPKKVQELLLAEITA
ncbi:hypothetical protein Anapl_07006 [Anas platyrhynchos]|uniref:Uncharacterized protein n=1 Tax=Anas platyrhynchos TaxID=8839 RepID=R0KEQ1_ANAPL|nr:hypothetical protein Anapl_07006 [Anas platyrhynchos]